MEYWNNVSFGYQGSKFDQLNSVPLDFSSNFGIIWSAAVKVKRIWGKNAAVIKEIYLINTSA